MSTEIVRPDERLFIVFKGEKTELFMSYLRLNSCVRVLGEPQNLPAIFASPDLTEAMLQIVLSKGGTGAMAEVVLGDEDMSHDDFEKIIDWVHGHLTYFFMTRFQRMAEAAKQAEPSAQALLSQANGSANSTSNEPSAGPSASSPANSANSSEG